MAEWNFKEMVREYGYEFLQENDYETPIEMDMLDEFFNSSWEAIRSAFYGGRYGFERDSFNPNDDYFVFNGHGNIESIPYIEDWYEDSIDEDYFKEWCIEQGYYEEDEEEE